MPNKEAHIGSGIIAIVILLLIFGFSILLLYWLHIIIFLFATILPDIIEPAYDYDHRDFFHSYLVMKILTVVTIGAIMLGYYYNNNLYYLGAFSGGYVLHLYLDAGTTMGLPLD